MVILKHKLGALYQTGLQAYFYKFIYGTQQSYTTQYTIQCAQ